MTVLFDHKNVTEVWTITNLLEFLNSFNILSCVKFLTSIQLDVLRLTEKLFFSQPCLLLPTLGEENDVTQNLLCYWIEHKGNAHIFFLSSAVSLYVTSKFMLTTLRFYVSLSLDFTFLRIIQRLEMKHAILCFLFRVSLN